MPVNTREGTIPTKRAGHLGCQSHFSVANGLLESEKRMTTNIERRCVGCGYVLVQTDIDFRDDYTEGHLYRCNNCGAYYPIVERYRKS